MGFLLFTGLILGLIPAAIAYKKGRSFILWWIFGILLWIVALIASICIKKDEVAIANRENLVQCPFCLEWIKRGSTLCRHCKSDLSDVEFPKFYEKYERTERKSVKDIKSLSKPGGEAAWQNSKIQ